MIIEYRFHPNTLIKWLGVYCVTIIIVCSFNVIIIQSSAIIKFTIYNETDCCLKTFFAGKNDSIIKNLINTPAEFSGNQLISSWLK